MKATLKNTGKVSPRDKEDTQALKKLLGGKKDFVELHEIWLIKEYRGRGYGEMFQRAPNPTNQT
jgi:hypothetical protein